MRTIYTHITEVPISVNNTLKDYRRPVFTVNITLPTVVARRGQWNVSAIDGPNNVWDTMLELESILQVIPLFAVSQRRVTV